MRRINAYIKVKAGIEGELAQSVANQLQLKREACDAQLENSKLQDELDVLRAAVHLCCTYLKAEMRIRKLKAGDRDLAEAQSRLAHLEKELIEKDEEVRREKKAVLDGAGLKFQLEALQKRNNDISVEILSLSTANEDLVRRNGTLTSDMEKLLKQ